MNPSPCQLEDGWHWNAGLGRIAFTPRCRRLTMSRLFPNTDFASEGKASEAATPLQRNYFYAVPFLPRFERTARRIRYGREQAGGRQGEERRSALASA